jgi:hypothetical protein
VKDLTKGKGMGRARAYKSASWGSVVKHYKDLIEQHRHPYQPMLHLVQTLANSQAAKELFPHTSMNTLVIASDEEWRPDDNLLVIDYKSSSRTFSFEHRTLSKTNDKKVCAEKEAFETLRLFLKYKFSVLLNLSDENRTSPTN